MSTGRLGVAALAANTDTTVYTVPASTIASCNIAVVNRGSVDAVVNVAIATTGTPATSEYVEFGVTVPANGILERTALVAGTGERVVVRASTADVSVRVHGYERAE